jgi:hypothetical protein
MLRNRSLAQAAALALGACLHLTAAAWGGVTTGKVSQLHVTGAGNLPLRVNLEGNPVLCTGGLAEAYLDDTDANYKTYAAALLMAKATGATVTLYADVGLYSRCRIGYLVLQ